MYVGTVDHMISEQNVPKGTTHLQMEYMMAQVGVGVSPDAWPVPGNW